MSEARRYSIQIDDKITDFTKKHLTQNIEGTFAEVLEKIENIAQTILQKELLQRITEKYDTYKKLEKELS
jgi:uncharacterized protein YqgV (UPF0045/DUF77 family)